MTTSKPQSQQDELNPSGTPVRQLSIFLHNRVGSLMSLVKLLAENHIEVLGLSLQDTTDVALLRVVPSDPETAELLFIEKGIPHAICPVTVVELNGGGRSLAQALAALHVAEVNIDFSYPLLVRPDHWPLLALHLDEPELGPKVLAKAGFKVLMQEDLSR